VVGFADIPSLEGRTFTGEPFVLSALDQRLFERATWIDRAYPDPDPPEFPSDIVEGFFSLALLDALATFTVRFDPETTYGFNYGLDRVRFAAPLRLGDRIEPRFEFKAIREKSPGFLVLRHCTLTAEAGERPAVIADWWTFVLPRGSDVAASPPRYPTERQLP
jgi:acyl dehydratase